VSAKKGAPLPDVLPAPPPKACRACAFSRLSALLFVGAPTRVHLLFVTALLLPVDTGKRGGGTAALDAERGPRSPRQLQQHRGPLAVHRELPGQRLQLQLPFARTSGGAVAAAPLCPRCRPCISRSPCHASAPSPDALAQSKSTHQCGITNPEGGGERCLHAASAIV